ncbi:MAG: hypothetical protein ACP5H2_00810 [Solirubrobacteraceae bacterium]
MVLLPVVALEVIAAALVGNAGKGVSILIYASAALLVITIIDLTAFIAWERRKPPEPPRQTPPPDDRQA